jgi:glycosyltransferase involved in cell wall biosynthesis
MLRDAAQIWKPDIVQAEFGAMGIYLPAARATGARTVVTFHDPEPAAAHERAAQSSGAEWMMWRTEAALWHVYDRRLLGSVDAAVAFTDRDARILSALNSRANVTSVPLGANVPHAPADPIGTSPPLLLFVGNFNHPPNVDAARFLLDDLFPILRTRNDGLSLALVGDHPPDWLRARADRQVRVTGFVRDLGPMMNDATVFVAPLRQGGGMRLKVLDALAAGKATVGTPIAFEGTGARHDQHALVAESAAGLCEAIERLLRDPGRRVELGRAAREHVTRSLSWERTAAAYGELYDRLLSQPTGSPSARQRRDRLAAREDSAESHSARDH